MKLLIALPALDEEESIGSTIERTLAARPHIIAGGVVTAVEVTVVSDGSTDRTVAIAQQYQDLISLVVFPQNRGYGVAIKEAWRRSDAELLAFMDADGTCNPEVFRELCAALFEENADVALGARLTPTSQMPRLRRIGNVLFARLLSAIAASDVRDSASGMRVVRRRCVPDLMPLPDGLHFTPAMSARALLTGELKLTEVPMPYAERAGESKLRVVRDGFRFLGAILDATLLYRPARLLEPLALAAAGAAVALMALPIFYYLRHAAVAEWMIYRFLIGQLLATVGLLLIGASYVTTRIAGLMRGRPPRWSVVGQRVARLVEGTIGWLVASTLVVLGTWLVWPGLRELLATGEMAEHWSRFVVMVFFWQVATMLLVFKGIGYGLDLVLAKQISDRHPW